MTRPPRRFHAPTILAGLITLIVCLLLLLAGITTMIILIVLALQNLA